MESNALLSLSRPVLKSMSLIPTYKVAQACERVRLRRLPREACYGEAEKHTVTLHEECGEVTSAEEGDDVDRPCGSRTRCQLVKLAMEFHELNIGGDDQLLPAQGGAEDTVAP